jgi:uncharacterized protein (DUF427 family)
VTTARPPAETVKGRIPDGVWIEPSRRWVRVYFGGTKIADTKQVLLVFERGGTRSPGPGPSRSTWRLGLERT